MKIDGSDVRRLTNTRGTEASPQWSPVGPFISYTFDSATTPVLGYSSDAVIMNVDDGTRRDHLPATSRGRREITYSRQAYYRHGAIGWETRVIGTDGVDRRFPEGSTYQDYNLIWRP